MNSQNILHAALNVVLWVIQLNSSFRDSYSSNQINKTGKVEKVVAWGAVARVVIQ